MNPKSQLSFAVERAFSGRESNAVAMSCREMGAKFRFVDSFEEVGDAIPVGSVGFVEKALGKHFVPDYFPSFVDGSLIGRKFWNVEASSLRVPLGREVFVKPADEYKRFTGYVLGPDERIRETGSLILQDIVEFGEEYRYYISNGRLVCGEWYTSSWETDPDIIPKAPPLPVSLDIPSGWCGTLDFGFARNLDGLILIEAHHPFSCGWYGEMRDHRLYTDWLVSGYEYLKNF